MADKNKRIRIFVVDVEKQETRLDSTDCSLEDLHRLINCDTIDIVTREIGGKPYAIICDDNGLLDQRTYSAISPEGAVRLVGNLVISNFDENGDLARLTGDDEKRLMRALRTARDYDGKEYYVIMLDN